ncbi:MAG: hypothetical protein U1C96_04800 [Gallionella sp.]|nr:hypothetical protein [Gallionella sp.]
MPLRQVLCLIFMLAGLNIVHEASSVVSICKGRSSSCVYNCFGLIGITVPLAVMAVSRDDAAVDGFFVSRGAGI